MIQVPWNGEASASLKGLLTLICIMSQFVWTNSVSAQSPEVPFCDAGYLSGCLELDSDICLEKTHACGRYNSIIQHFGSESIGGSSETARYYKGASYYGLYVRNRAYSLKCQFSSQARAELIAFLFSKKESGFRTQTDFNRVYHAAKIVKELRTVEGCPETGVTEDEIRYTVESYADRVLKSLFVGSTLEGGLGDTVKQTKRDIQAVVGGFVSVAAATETQLEMREVALEASYVRLAKIAETFEKNFGPAVFNVDDKDNITISLQLDPNRGFRKAEIDASNWKFRVDQVEQRFYQAMGNMNINDYENARKGMVARADYAIQRAASIANFNNNLGDKGRSTGIVQLERALSQEGQGSGAGKVLEEIKGTWQNSSIGGFSCIFGFPKPWYCDGLDEETFSFFAAQ